MPRTALLYFNDLTEAIDAIEQYVESLSFEQFCLDRKTYSASLREYIIIGEAVAKLMDMLEAEFPDYPWRMIKDFRNLIVHEYFGVDPKIVWDLTTQELPILKKHIQQLTTKTALSS